MIELRHLYQTSNLKPNHFNIHLFHSTRILLYEKNGDKYTGIWDDWDKGQGEVNYKDGTKYKGHWELLKGGDSIYEYMRHGIGTLYSADGQVLNQGKWEKNEYKVYE